MKRVITILVGNLKMWIRSKHTLFWTIAFPVLMILLFGSIFSISGNPKFDLHIQDQDNTPMSHSFIRALNETEAFNLIEVSATTNTTEFIKEKGISRILIIPQGFQENITNREDASIILKIVPEQLDSSSSVVMGIIDSIVDAFNAHLPPPSPPKAKVQVQTESIVSERFGYIDFFVPGVVGMTVMTGSVFGAIGWSARNRELGILKKLATTPLTKLECIVGIVLYQMIMAFVSTAIIFTVGTLVFGMKVVPDIFCVVLIISGVMAFSGIGMVIARFVKESEGADAAGNAITFPMMFLSGSFFPREMMPEFLQQISKVLPLTYFNDGLRDAMIYGNIASALTNTAIMVVVGAFFIILGAVITSWREE